jgi:hypothetical protein
MKTRLVIFTLCAGALLTAQTVGTQNVQGTVGSGATDAGNPVKVGGIYNSSPITLTNGQRGDHQLDAAGYLKVNVAAGGSNAAASATGSAVPASASYNAVNVAGTLRGQTGVNPSGSIYANQIDLASVAGTTVATGAAGIMKVALTDGSGTTLNSTTNALNVNVTNASLAVTQSGAWNVGQTGTWTMVPKTTCSTTAADSGYLANIPTTGTDFFASTTCINTLTISNITASDSTFTVQDKTATPNVYYSAQSLPAKTAVLMNLGYLKFNLGMTVKCGAATTCQGQANGWQ